jgi:hypothetical protein
MGRDAGVNRKFRGRDHESPMVSTLAARKAQCRTAFLGGNDLNFNMEIVLLRDATALESTCGRFHICPPVLSDRGMVNLQKVLFCSLPLSISLPESHPTWGVMPLGAASQRCKISICLPI